MKIDGADIHARNADGWTPLTMCVRWSGRPAAPLDALAAVYELMKLGAVYEDSPDNCPAMSPDAKRTRPGSTDELISAFELGASIPICIQQWTVEQQAGKPLTRIPHEVAGNGVKAVQSYLEQIAK
ncbi:hypothetical protein Poli38472_013124 [Pythium oligandrum]|uniref:Uncharacterized protein n=1 Tax=Pythium oligandrum TaxID=41045 RepID=A0A8K1C2G9_PYTOL|nr:hypothetical protein Poli38472_013124 [Pythium oligandrum]|eukprot:TMW55233.1 hypothetical protein Poli38472_013124 [Pythium oligandrum]